MNEVCIIISEVVEEVVVTVSETTGAKGDPGEIGPPGPKGDTGTPGKSVEIRATATHIQGRKEGEEWEDIIALSELTGENGVTPQKGVDYFDGEDGYTPQKGVDYFDGAPFTYDDFTPQQLASLRGADGKDIQIQVTGTHIQTRPVGGEWSNLIALSELKGEDGYTPQKGVDYFDGEDGADSTVPGPTGYTPVKGVDYFDGEDGTEIELQKTTTHVQWRYVGGSWTDLIALTDIKGENGSDATVTKSAVESVLTGDITTHDHAIARITGLQTALNGKADILSRSSCFTIESDFFSANVSAACPGLLGAAISSGTSAAVTGQVNHPGILYLRDSTTANGGFRYMTEVASFLIAGGEKAVFVFQVRGARSTASSRLGWQDSTAIQTAPTDGVWFEVTGDGTNATLVGRCKNNAGPSTTADPYQLTLNTWYTGIIEVNSDATLVTFTLYAENGTQLWQKTVNANIPTASGRETGFGIIAGETTTDAAADILWIDYLRMEINRTLAR